MNDGSAPDHHPLPLFLVERADDPAQLGSSRIFKIALVVLAVSAIGTGVLTFADPLTRLVAVTASPVDVSAPQPDNRQTATTIQSAADIQAPPTIQSTADVQAPPATVADTSTRQESTGQDSPQEARQETPQQAPQQTRQEVAAVSEPADRTQTQTSESSEALFRQFQAWSQERDSRQADQAQGSQVASAQRSEPARSKRAQSARDGSAKVESDDRAARTAKRHRRVRALQSARAEMRSERQARARAARERGAELRARQVEEARAQEQPVQNPPPAQPSALSQFFGWQH